MKKSARIPTSETAKRIGAIMRRRPTTPSNDAKEVRPFRNLSPHVSDDDLTLVEEYYARNWPPRSNVNHLRHDLATLINNWQGEVDRARIWTSAHPRKQPPRKIIPLPRSLVQPEPFSPEERLAAANDFEKLMGRRPTWEKEA